MQQATKFYINGEWVDPVEPRTMEVINPATEQAIGIISLGSAADVDRAVAAARAAFPAWSATSREERLAVLGRIIEAYKARYEDIATTISQEMGAPITLARKAQAAMGLAHLATTMEVLKNFAFDEDHGTTVITREPIGVVGMITPWNWPINQIVAKVAPALAAGCTMVLKPTEIAPLNAMLFAEVMHAAGVPKGVFNLVNGDGPSVGTAMSSHPDIDMMSFTGSTRAGIQVAKNGADTVKRVALELGGKSPNIILDDADFPSAIAGGVLACFINTGQTCTAATRMLVPRGRQEEAVAIAKATAEAQKFGDPTDPATTHGPLVSLAQWEKVQRLIQVGIDEGARLVTGGIGKPEGINAGYFARPTVFADVTNSMTIAREEIFGPVLSILPYDSEEEAIAVANDTPYGLAGYVSSGNVERARKVARQIRAGNVHINGAPMDVTAPFGGYKQSGIGREFGEHGLVEFLEVKAMLGYNSRK
ncbi:aldehyde dehydrogenase family protein [Parapedomonas caeni]